MATKISNLQPRLIMPVGERDHALGPAMPTVTLVEYGDYQCPHCLAAYPIIIGLQERLGDQLRQVFRNFPLSTLHPHAEHAAEAAEAAAAQGKFWEMHDYLFEHQSHLDDAALVRYATEIGLDVERFARDLNEHKFATRVKEDFQSGIRSGVNGTPTFFINDLRHDEAWDLETLTNALLAAID